MVRIFFVRHGKTQWNLDRKFQGQTDIPLLDSEVKKSRQAGEAIRFVNNSLGGANFKRVYCMGLKRTRQTSSAVVEGIQEDIPITTTDLFKEMRLGKLEGKDKDSSRTEKMVEGWDSIRGNAELREQGVESPRSVGTRSMNAVVKMVNAHKRGDAIVIVSHNRSLQTLLPQLMGEPRSALTKYKVPNGSVTAMDINMTAHGLEVVPHLLLYEGHRKQGEHEITLLPKKSIVIPLRRKKSQRKRR